MPGAEVCFSPNLQSWDVPVDASTQEAAVNALEGGKILFFPELPFPLEPRENTFIGPDSHLVQMDIKSVKYSPSQDRLWGVPKGETQTTALHGMLRRYARKSRALVEELLPAYKSGLIVGNTSFRPVETAGRKQSKRHNDQLLHVDAFPSRPNGGQRIMRVFANVNPNGKPRVWHVGEPFADVAQRFMPTLPAPLPGSAALLKLFKLTKSRRTPYDHYMLGLHDGMKLSDDYQREAPQTEMQFPPGSTWIVFTDEVSHAALSGQFAFEQTFMLPVEAMVNPAMSPLRVLERLTQKKLN
jgi:hypothetical protein